MECKKYRIAVIAPHIRAMILIHHRSAATFSYLSRRNPQIKLILKQNPNPPEIRKVRKNDLLSVSIQFVRID